MSYRQIFQEAQPDYNPEHIEKIVRLGHPTLDHLTREELIFEASIAAPAIDEHGAEFVEALV